VKEPSFYAYAAPRPAGFENAKVGPEGAYYDTGFAEFILPYGAVSASDSSSDALTRFMSDTYDAAADLATWDRAGLERP
jgi:hypothetical protein